MMPSFNYYPSAAEFDFIALATAIEVLKGSEIFVSGHFPAFE